LVFWADFEGDARTGVEAYAEYSQQKMTWEQFTHTYSELHTMRYIRVKERLIIKEKLRRERSFEEITKGLSIFSNKKQLYLFHHEQVKKLHIEEERTKRVRIKEIIDSLYSYFSTFIHVNNITLKSLSEWEERISGRDREAIYYNYYYIESLFTASSEDLWAVIDLVIETVVLEKSRFYGYSFPVDFLKVYVAKNEEAKELFDFITRNKLGANLPITSMVIQVLRSS
jgi:hypothetical protein